MRFGGSVPNKPLITLALSSWKKSGVRGTPQFSKKRPENAGANENLWCGLPSIPGTAPGVAPRILVFCIAQVLGCHSENGISYSEDGTSNSESCSENTPEHSQSSENGLFAQRAFFPEIGVVPRLLKKSSRWGAAVEK